MAKDDTDFIWQNNVDVATFSTPTQERYKAFKDLQRLAAAAREEFETSLKGEISVPAGHRIAFNYRFGNLSIGIGEGEAKAKAKAENKPKVGLQAWLDAQANSGRRS